MLWCVGLSCVCVLCGGLSIYYLHPHISTHMCVCLGLFCVYGTCMWFLWVAVDCCVVFWELSMCVCVLWVCSHAWVCATYT